jgi:LysR family glycine cleavage system transcriptional activator
MQGLDSKLPPLKSLVAFEASARHLSFTRAAKELGISREAVSRQIRVLEEYLGVKLFDRGHRAMTLTLPGRKFEPVVRDSLENIAYVTGAIRQPGQAFTINVTSPIATASFWLTPRLPRFRSIHPNIEIHVAVSDTPKDLVADGLDVGFRYGDGHWKGLEAVRLFDINAYPVCSPEYLDREAPLNEPADLVQHNLVNLDGAVHASEDWSWWLEGQGVEVPNSVKVIGFDSYDNVIQVALDGQGVALGYSGLTTDLIAQGRLVRPMQSELTKGFAIYLVRPASVKPAPQVQAFIDWVLDGADRQID